MWFFLPPAQELLNLIDVEPEVQEMRGQLVRIPLCGVRVYLRLRVRGQPSPTSRGLDTGRGLTVSYRFCPQARPVAEERALSGQAVQFVRSNCTLPCSPRVPHELFVAVQVPLASPIAP